MGWGESLRLARIMVRATFVVLCCWATPALFAGSSDAEADGVAERVPILVYHNIDYSGSAYAVTPEMLEVQCTWLVENGYTAITLDQFYQAATGMGALPPNPVMLTNDDGWSSAVAFADILASHGLVGNYFINNYSPLTADQIARLTWNGPVQSHTAYHQYMSQLEYDRQFSEITTNQAYIGQFTGAPVLFLAWPFGDSNDSAVQAAKDAGIIAAFGLGGVPAYIGAVDLYHIPRYLMTPSDTLDTFIAKVTAW